MAETHQSDRSQPGPVMRVGIIGIGVASSLVIPELSADPRVRITAASDVRQHALERFAGEFDAETFDSAEGLCESKNVDLVYVLTPNRFHAQHAIIAAECGKQIMLDKPMALSLADCDAVNAAVRRNGVTLLVGHSQSLDPAVRAMAEIVDSGELGRRVMISTSFFSDWLYRPRSSDELRPEFGEGLVLRQGPVQVDIVRLLGGGAVRTVRAITTSLDPARPIDGSYMAFLEFEDGTPASLTYSAYGHFDSTELTYGIDLQGFPADPALHARTHQRYRDLARPEDEWAFKESTRYGGLPVSWATPARKPNAAEKRHSFFGFTLVSCEHGDIRQTPTGLAIYGKHGRRDVAVEAGPLYSRRYTSTEIDLLYECWLTGAPLPSHDGSWAKATVEVCLGIHQSAAERREIQMHHQTRYTASRRDL